MAFVKIKTPEFRVSFPSVFKPKGFGTQEPKYSVTMLFPKSKDGSRAKDLPELVKLLGEVVAEKWPDPTKRPKNLINPIKCGDTDEMQDGTLRGEKYPEMKGHWVIMASSKAKPGLVDENVQPIMDEDEFYSGCYAMATLTAFAYAPGKGREQSKTGVSFGLQNIRKTRDGEKFSGRASAADDFAEFKGSAPAKTAVTPESEDSMFG